MDFLSEWGLLIIIVLAAIFIIRKVVSFAMKLVVGAIFLGLAAYAIFYFIL